MKIKTYKELFWGCMLVFFVLNIVFYFVERISTDNFNNTASNMISFRLSMLQIILCAIFGFMIRKKANKTIIKKDDSEKKYMKVISVFVIVTIIFTIFLLDTTVMFFTYLDIIIYKITGLHQALFDYFDLWSLSACFVCAFFRIKRKQV